MNISISHPLNVPPPTSSPLFFNGKFSTTDLQLRWVINESIALTSISSPPEFINKTTDKTGPDFIRAMKNSRSRHKNGRKNNQRRSQKERKNETKMLKKSCNDLMRSISANSKKLKHQSPDQVIQNVKILSVATGIASEKCLSAFGASLLNEELKTPLAAELQALLNQHTINELRYENRLFAMRNSAVESLNRLIENIQNSGIRKPGIEFKLFAAKVDQENPMSILQADINNCLHNKAQASNLSKSVLPVFRSSIGKIATYCDVMTKIVNLLTGLVRTV